MLEGMPREATPGLQRPDFRGSPTRGRHDRRAGSSRFTRRRV